MPLNIHSRLLITFHLWQNTSSKNFIKNFITRGSCVGLFVLLKFGFTCKMTSKGKFFNHFIFDFILNYSIKIMKSLFSKGKATRLPLIYLNIYIFQHELNIKLNAINNSYFDTKYMFVFLQTVLVRNLVRQKNLGVRQSQRHRYMTRLESFDINISILGIVKMFTWQ